MKVPISYLQRELKRIDPNKVDYINITSERKEIGVYLTKAAYNAHIILINRAFSLLAKTLKEAENRDSIYKQHKKCLDDVLELIERESLTNPKMLKNFSASSKHFINNRS